MTPEMIWGMLVPFVGTTLGASCVLLMKRTFGKKVECALTGSAAGVMTAASVWSLLLPAIGQCEESMGQLAFIPAAAGFMAGIGFLMLTDRLIPLISGENGSHGVPSDKKLMLLAVTLHNIPEGMVVGVVYAGVIYGSEDITAAAAFALALGIAIQNFPEGAIVSMPLHASGMSRTKAFLTGTLSGAVEPVGAVLTLAAAGLVIPAMPYLLSFAAGAMIYVVVAELVPETEVCPGIGVLSFAVGFVIMMSLDVALG